MLCYTCIIFPSTSHRLSPSPFSFLISSLLQQAKKGVVFVSFALMLHLHLMWFQYDPATDTHVNINNRYHHGNNGFIERQ